MIWSKEFKIEVQKITAANAFSAWLFRFLHDDLLFLNNALDKNEIVFGFIPAYRKKFHGLGVLAISNKRFLFIKKKIRIEIPIKDFEVYFYESKRKTFYVRVGDKTHSFWIFNERISRHFMQRIKQAKKMAERFQKEMERENLMRFDFTERKLT